MNSKLIRKNYGEVSSIELWRQSWVSLQVNELRSQYCFLNTDSALSDSSSLVEVRIEYLKRDLETLTLLTFSPRSLHLVMYMNSMVWSFPIISPLHRTSNCREEQCHKVRISWTSVKEMYSILMCVTLESWIMIWVCNVNL